MFRAAAVDEHDVELVKRDAAAKQALFPVVLGGDGANEGTELRGQRGPDHDRVEMARVVGEVDALFGGRRTALPVGVGADEQPREPHDGRH